MDLSKKIRRNPNVVWRRETKGGKESGILLFNYETQKVHFLNSSGKKVWEACENITIATLAKKLELTVNELQNYIARLKERGLIIVEDGKKRR